MDNLVQVPFPILAIMIIALVWSVGLNLGLLVLYRNAKRWIRLLESKVEYNEDYL